MSGSNSDSISVALTVEMLVFLSGLMFV